MKANLLVLFYLFISLSSCTTLKYNCKYEGDEKGTVNIVSAEESKDKKIFTPKEITLITTQVDSIFKINNFNKRELNYITNFNFHDCTWFLNVKGVPVSECLCYYLRLSNKKDQSGGIHFFFDQNLKLIYYENSYIIY